MSSSLLRSSRTKLFSSFNSSLSRTFHSTAPPSPQIGALPPLFHRTNSYSLSPGNENPSNANLTGLPKPSVRDFGNLNGLRPLSNPVNNLGIGSTNKVNLLSYNAFGQGTIALAGAGYGIGSSRVCATRDPMLLGIRSADAYTSRLAGHSRVMSTVAGSNNETKAYGLRPLSPHLPVYQPQLSSTLSIFNRITGAILSAVILLFYMIYMKVGLISLTFGSFYDFLFYSSKLNLFVLEISGLALTYHTYMGIRHLLHRL
ncbi:Succinate dehydrogenase cytochrome B subunit mitochondrial [Stylosanthes scabra]|uniref:Succinate dehydrogenase cytochrome B subunit mitochondrial n=1 Tax=Stylosanthes scabra TaxID=79078 RepID=A0ABU6T2C8_9FABA|nr:Succinate dehydrogenase cytochrome B subunit mitochondrial [Stylosanthes scabra]